jgi:hypothetical protein
MAGPPGSPAERADNSIPPRIRVDNDPIRMMWKNWRKGPSWLTLCHKPLFRHFGVDRGDFASQILLMKA